MYIVVVACLMSAMLAKVLPPLPVRFSWKRWKSKIVTVRSALYFLPIWFILFFRWDTAPDTRYGTGSYWRFFQMAILNQNLHRFFRYEPLSWGLLWLLARAGLSWFLMLGILSTIYCISFERYISKCSKNPSLSIIFFLLVNLITIGASSLRQAISITFLLMAYSRLFQEDIDWNLKEKLRVTCFCALGALCHSSALFVVPLLWICDLKIKRFQACLLALGFAVFYYPLTKVMTRLLFPTKWANVSTDRMSFANSYLLLSGFILLVFLLYYPILMQTKSGQRIFNFNLFYFIITIYSAFYPDAYRVIQLFSPLMIIELPNLIVKIPKRKDRTLILLICLLTFSILFLRTAYIMKYGSSGFHYHSVFSIGMDALLWK